MEARRLQGVFPILVTPFDEKGRIDEESLMRLVEFNIDAGVHGLGVAIGSEVFKLSEAERADVIRCVVAATAKRVPVVVNTVAGGTDLAVAYSRAAEEAGADALMIMPPAFLPAGPAEVLDYFRAISAAVTIPIFLQDTPAAPISPGLARRLAEARHYPPDLPSIKLWLTNRQKEHWNIALRSHRPVAPPAPERPHRVRNQTKLLTSILSRSDPKPQHPCAPLPSPSYIAS